MKIDWKLILHIVIVSFIVSFFSNLLFGKFFGVTETDVWKKTSIETIHKIGELEVINKNMSEVINKMIEDLKTLNSDSVNTVLIKYGVNYD